MGCWTGYDNGQWGSPTDGVFEKGADCTLGWKDTIYSHGLYGGVWRNGAEEYSDRFWQRLKEGWTAWAAHNNAKTLAPQSASM
jgi:hypothetical protein